MVNNYEIRKDVTKRGSLQSQRYNFSSLICLLARSEAISVLFFLCHMVLNLSVCCRDQLRGNEKACQLQVVFLRRKIHFGVLKCSFLEIKEWINKMKKKNDWRSI